MTDYHPLIARAVEGLDKSTGEARRALYERARHALVTQLRGNEPPLAESDITKERLALEEAIRRVEAEAARKSRATPQVQARAEPRGPRPAMPKAATIERAASNSSPPAVPRADRSSPPLQDRARGVRAEARRAEPARAQDSGDGREPNGRRAPPSGRDRLSGGRRPTNLAQEGIKGFRDVVSEVHDLGAATAKAAQSARDTRDSYVAAPQRLVTPAPAAAPSPSGRFALQLDVAEPAKLDARRVRSPEPEEIEDEPPEQPPLLMRPQPPRVRRQDAGYTLPSLPQSYQGLIKPLAALIVFVLIIGVFAWQWSNITQLFVHSGPTKPVVQATTQDTPATPSTPTQSKIGGRVPQPQGTEQATVGAPTSSQPTAAVAQRVVLYEEDPNDPQGKRYVGSAIWRTETVSPGPGLAPELAVRADITIPERHITATWSLRRNTDKSLPASHTIEIMFNLPSDFPGGGISNVPGILMKQAEQARGTPLAGLAVKVTNGFFLVGLNAADTDMQRNIALLKDRSWFDIPVVYTNGGRAILAMEKGPPGERAFAEAFAAWDKK